jgi:hypothetical protein
MTRVEEFVEDLVTTETKTVIKKYWQRFTIGLFVFCCYAAIVKIWELASDRGVYEQFTFLSVLYFTVRTVQALTSKKTTEANNE